MPVTKVNSHATRAWLVVVMLLCGPSPGVGVAGADVFRPPVPVPGNPAPGYPEQARAKGIEGPVEFRVLIGANGEVVEIEILEVPEEGLGFEETVEQALSEWRFEPATKNGSPVAESFLGQIDFTLTMPPSAGRMYAASSSEAWAQLKGFLDDHKFSFERFNDAEQVVVTKWRGTRSKRLPGLTSFEMSPGFYVREFQLHLFVSPFAEPARIYVGSMVKARDMDDNERIFYNTGRVESWLFDRFEERLGTTGFAIPVDLARRNELAAQLRPGQPGPACPPIDDVSIIQWDGETGEVQPKLIEASKQLPIFPERARSRREVGNVILQALIFEDGWVGDVEVLRANTPDPEFSVSAKQTVSLWRYRPAKRNGCAIPVYFTVFVEFKLHY